MRKYPLYHGLWQRLLKHHTLLHEDEDQKVSLIAQAVHAESTSILMAAVVEVKAKRRAHVCVFLDSGAQVSFISQALATASEAPQVGMSHIDIKGFGAPSHATDAPVRSLTLVQQDGTICEILALEQRKLDLNIQVFLEKLRKSGKIEVFV